MSLTGLNTPYISDKLVPLDSAAGHSEAKTSLLYTVQDTSVVDYLSKTVAIGTRLSHPSL